MASMSNFTINVKGYQSHGSAPQDGHDAIVAASAIVMALQTYVSRMNNPINPLVLSVGKFHGGAMYNIICPDVELEGTIRTYSRTLRNTMKEDLHQVMKEQGLVEGFDVGLEMSGNGMALQQMIDCMRNGGKISLLGISNKPVALNMNTIITKGLTMQGIYGRKMDTWHQMSYMVQGGLDVSPIITHRFHYTDFEKGFEAMNSGLSGKVILDWTTKK